MFAGPSDVVAADLYAAVVRGPVTRTRTTLSLGPSAKVSGDTYFGRFPASYWQRWTDVTEVRVEARVSGEGRLSIGASDTKGPARVVATCTVRPGMRDVVLAAPLDRFVDGGSLWADLETDPGQRLTVEHLRWTVGTPPARRPAALVICTTDRPLDCLATLNALTSDETALEALGRVYVVDHGADRLGECAGFEEVARRLGERLHYLVQANLGGAGGFTRGLVELAGDPATETMSALFMDDDVLLEPDVIIRLTAFGDHTAHPMIVGGQMLNLFHPGILLADSQQCDIDGLQPGLPMPYGMQDVDLLHDALQERRLDAGANGWWACLIPREVVDGIGYPLPFFFQADDAEYSYRARAYGFPTITLPGAGLWHADFAAKDLDELNRYFLLRNYLIISALHGRFGRRRLLTKLGGELVQHLLSMRYGLAATLLKAVEDFLTGPEVLADGGVTALSEVRELRAAFPETRPHPATRLPGVASDELRIVNAGPRPRLVTIRRMVAGLCGRHRHALGAIPHDEAYWWHVALFRVAVVTDASQRGMRVRRYDRRRMLSLAAHGGKVLFRLLTHGAAVRERYRRALPELSSRESWARIYGLPRSEPAPAAR
ncbi:glycosyltransferase [Nonomuraea sp. NPDC049607]|uniref:glycosyltransferase n=1 Tax=unclassified Nonomuraea TaxID=2593643 RepID=UPI0034158497